MMSSPSSKRNRIISVMVVGPHEGDRRLREVLEQRKALSDDVLVCGNNLDPKTAQVIEASDVWFYRDDREWGREQPRIKQELLRRAAKLKPDWFLASDADELYDPYFTREAAEELAQSDAVGYYFAIINLWDDEAHYRHDLSFHNIRFFRFMPDMPLTLSNKSLHCGWAPPFVYAHARYAPHFIIHYGLIDERIRSEKTARYAQYDPSARFKGREYYDKLEGKVKGQLLPFEVTTMHERILRDHERHYRGRQGSKSYQHLRNHHAPRT